MRIASILTAAVTILSVANSAPTKTEETKVSIQKRDLTIGQLISYIEDVILGKPIPANLPIPSGVPTNPGLALAELIPKDLLNVQLGDLVNLQIPALPTSVPELLQEIGNVL
ncbi:uncharacterized protein RJT21DRAFT_3755 [Scheffersomyces amazonensis]|uniref:uncharacterized protein n=1 Tax=Scheffersomyces amazonensis TaxID=1078765 RepID=UPI00315C8219